jgi:acyl carrier protein
MREKIIEIILKYAENDNVSIDADTSLVTDLGLTSLDILKISMNLEEEFGIEFDEDEVAEITTLGDLEDCIKRLQEN